MADGILGFFSPEAGQARRRRLQELGAGLEYYVPPELRQLVGLLGELSPVEGVGRAGQAAQGVMQPGADPLQRVEATGRMLSEMAGVAAPAAVAGRVGMPAAQAIQEGLLGFSAGAQDVGRAVANRLNQPGPMPTVYSNPVMRADQPQGIRAYHGSPHDFDRFSMEKIGTGEGAQAYGHGLYFAENEGVARGYRDALSRNLQSFDDPPRFKAFGDQEAKFIAPSEAQAIVNQGETAIRRRIQRIDDEVARLREQSQDDPGISEIIDGMILLYDGELQELNTLLREGFESNRPPRGRMYEVNIRANPEDFLDWDKPLSEQPQKVQEAFRPRIEELRRLGASIGNDPDGATLEQIAHPTVQLDDVDWSRGLRQQAADYMREAGIPGIRYLDAGSRYIPSNLPDNPIANEARQFLDQAQGDANAALDFFRKSNPVERWASVERDEIEKVIRAAGRQATRNYVVFDENLIEIVRKYGIAGAAALLGISQADLAQAMQQQQQPQGLLE